jgi:hypothetical protein
VELQVVFPTGRRRIAQPNLNLEHEVDLMVDGAVFGVAVLDGSDESYDHGFHAELFGDLADESGLDPLARLDVAARQE